MAETETSGQIHYLCSAEHSYTLGIFAAFYARESADAIRIVPFRVLPRVRSFGPGTFVFTDMDRVHHAGLAKLIRLADALAESGRPVLNHPRRALGRFPLLRRLHEAGINRFNVHRIHDWRSVTRFPVFIRREGEHGKSVTGLIENRPALQATVHALVSRAHPPDLMIVEFGNVAEADGRYRKYASFRVGNRIYCQHCYASRDWWVKFSSSDLGEERKRELAAYVRSNPHSNQLMEIFDLAEIDYGRADYCVVDGRVQIFEINTNPTIIQSGAASLTDISPYAHLHDEAMVALAAQGAGEGKVDNPLFAGKAELSIGFIHRGELDHARTHWNPANPPQR